MYNRERLTRWLFYIFAAFMVASCGGGGDIFSVNGQSSTSVVLQLDSNQITPSGQTNVTVNLHDANNNPINGSATLSLSGAGALGSKVVSIVNGVGTTTLAGNNANPGSTGDIQAMFVDAQKNVSKSTPVPFTVIDPATVPSNYKMGTPSICVSGESLPCNSVIYISGTLKSSATVSTTILSPANQPVVNARVIFSLTVPNRGTLSALGGAISDPSNSSVQAVGITDAAGKASVTLSGIGATAGYGTVHVSYIDPNLSTLSKDATYRVQSGYNISLSSGASNLINASVGAAINITATVTTPDGVSVNDGVPVVFSIPPLSGAQLIIPGTAGAIATRNGQAVQTLQLLDNSTFNNGVILVSARLLNDPTVAPVSYEVDVSGASISITSAAPTAQPGDITSFVVTLKDAGGNGIPNKQLTLTPSNLGIVSVTNAGVTDTYGQVVVKGQVTANSGLVGLSANWGTGTISGNLSLSIRSTALSITSNESSVDLAHLPIQAVVPGGLSYVKHPFVVKLVGASANQPLPVINSTLGTVSDLVKTGVGLWTFNISSTFPGDALVEVDVANPDTADTANPTLKIVQKLTFISTFPTVMTLQAGQTSLKAGAQTSLIARVTDANDNPVSGLQIAFNRVADPSGGSLDLATAVTDATGRAVVTFTAGPNTTGTDKVKISSAAAGLSAAVDLTVGGSAVFISIGTGNTILVDTPTGYQLPHQIMVTDAAGNPVSNATVALKLIPVQYYKGEYYFDAGAKMWLTSGPLKSEIISGTVIYTPTPLVVCSNEDMNLNGILDVLYEDNGSGAPMSPDQYPATNFDVEDNKDGVLWPGNPATLSTGTVLTGTNGVAYFSVNYGRSYANWIRAKLIATVVVSGSESQATRLFDLPGLATDFNQSGVAPPGGLVSPYGRGATCSDKN